MDIEQVCFELICHVGEARSSFIDAIQQAKKGDFEQAATRMNSGQESFNMGHQVHAKLIQAEMEGMRDHLSLILIHAEDQMMSAENFKLLSGEFIDLYQRLAIMTDSR